MLEHIIKGNGPKAQNSLSLFPSLPLSPSLPLPLPYYDHWLEIRRELVLFPKIFRQFSEFVPTIYVGRIWGTKRNSEQIRRPKRNSAQIRNKFGDQKEIRPKFGTNSETKKKFGTNSARIRGEFVTRSKLASAGGTQPATTIRFSRAHSSAGSAVAHAKGRRFDSTHEKL